MQAGYYMTDYKDANLENGASVVAPTQQTPQTTKIPWYENPGFWSKVGATGAALLPKWNRLKEAGEYAATYHQGQQLDRAQQRMFANVAAGRSPMEGFTEADTMGLDPKQITDLNKTGVERASALVKEEREGRLADSTINYQNITSGYQKKLEERVNRELQQEDMFVKYLDDVAEGRVESKYINKENLDMFRGLGAKRATAIIEEIVKQEEIAKRQGIKTEKIDLKNKIMLVNSQTGMPIQTWDVGVDPNKTASDSDKSWHFTQADTHAFREMLPTFKAAYFKTFGDNAATAEKFNKLAAMIGDPQLGPGAISEIVSSAPINMYNEYVARKNEIAKSLSRNEGIPERRAPIDSTGLPKAKQTPKEIESIVKNPGFESTMNSAIKGKAAGDYNIRINGKDIPVRVNGKGGWEIITGGGK